MCIGDRIRVVTGHDFYDFEAKYLSESDVELVCPADIPDDIAEEVRRLAAAAFESLGCEGLARVDCFYTCLLYTSPSPRDRTRSRMPSSA